MEKIDLVPIKELFDKNFFIPRYQRGYRWTQRQVIDLLEDIKEFMENDAIGIYCIQPLVVKGRPKEEAINNIRDLFNTETDPTLADIQRELLLEKWDVIDGQQRLTTIKILLAYLQKGSNAPTYNLDYETRKGSSDFLNNIAKPEHDASLNIDFYHMRKSYETISAWFESNVNENTAGSPLSFNKTNFLKILNDKVHFIWYETDEEDPIKVFTRLNTGKIALTDAELIKALFLNQSNFKSENKDSIRMQQIEIANEWDRIEYSLQNDEFWLFIQNNTDYKNTTRIDFIFDIIRKNDVLELKKILGDKYDEKIGNDEHQTFRYFYEYFKVRKKEINAEWLRAKWLKVKNIFLVFEEWFNDRELYHYVGFLIERGCNLYRLLKRWKKTKEDFMDFIKTEIKDKIEACNNLTKEYEKGTSKTACYPILLLHNIQSVVNQNKNLESSKYGMSVYYKFPFHLMKSENWDMEHIDSNTNNPLDKFSDQKEWLEDCLSEISDVQLKEDIAAFIDSDTQPDTFGELTSKIYSKLNHGIDNLREPFNEGDVNEKNLIWNYCLLDSRTNRSYGNAIFPAKRRKIIEKDRGEKGVSFVPPCTKNIFLKYYNKQTNILRAWERTDAMAYVSDLNEVLSKAGFIPDQCKEIEKIYRHNDEKQQI